MLLCYPDNRGHSLVLMLSHVAMDHKFPNIYSREIHQKLVAGVWPSAIPVGNKNCFDKLPHNIWGFCVNFDGLDIACLQNCKVQLTNVEDMQLHGPIFYCPFFYSPLAHCDGGCLVNIEGHWLIPSLSQVKGDWGVRVAGVLEHLREVQGPISRDRCFGGV